jgi:transcriptional regulator with XRE-family HTH domain
VSHSNISKYESGSLEPNLEIINSASDYFKVSTDYLIGKTEMQNTQNSKLTEAEELIKVDPDLFVDMCRAKELPDEVRRRIREFAAFELEKHLREQQKKEWQ